MGRRFRISDRREPGVLDRHGECPRLRLTLPVPRRRLRGTFQAPSIPAFRTQRSGRSWPREGDRGAVMAVRARGIAPTVGSPPPSFAIEPLHT